MELIVKIEDSKIIPYNLALYSELLGRFNNKEVLLSIHQQKKKRSNDQNKYYWAVVIPMIQQGLFDLQGEYFGIEDTHNFLKQEFNFKEIVNKDTGEALKIGLSTTQLTTVEFMDFLDKIIDFADKFLNIKIPPPNGNG